MTIGATACTKLRACPKLSRLQPRPRAAGPASSSRPTSRSTMPRAPTKARESRSGCSAARPAGDGSSSWSPRWRKPCPPAWWPSSWRPGEGAGPWEQNMSRTSRARPQTLMSSCTSSARQAPRHQTWETRPLTTGLLKSASSSAESPTTSPMLRKNSAHARLGTKQTCTEASRTGRPKEREATSACQAGASKSVVSYLHEQSAS
mmetsp:Transcript_75640/g.214020  ORF Transcript_75640/g.214020 Transcript_75640/m.214020 type:complete len:204 (+) Transcript_75640:59-670(+)